MVLFLQDDKCVVIVFVDGMVWVWDIDIVIVFLIFDGYVDLVLVVVFSFDGCFIVIGLLD